MKLFHVSDWFIKWTLLVFMFYMSLLNFIVHFYSFKYMPSKEYKWKGGPLTFETNELMKF